MMERKGILVIGEVDDGKLSTLTRELLGGARRLGDETKEPTSLFLIGEKATPLAQQAIYSGADKVYIAAHPSFNEYNLELYISATGTLCSEIKPALCLLGQTDFGRDIAPRLAARLGSGLCMDCIDVNYDAGGQRFVQTRPVYGGKALAVMGSAASAMQINTVRAKSMEPMMPQESRVGEVIEFKKSGMDPAVRATRTGFSKLDESGLRLEDAKVIVAGGGGLGGPAGFELVKQLADLLKGAVGATRVPVDENWVPLSMEIGQTGKIVSPDLYIAVGISGAAQHITGCLNSKTIITINKDPDANMFKISDFGLVADYKEALPILIEKLKAAGM